MKRSLPRRLLDLITRAHVQAGVTTARSPATWFLDWLGGRESASGVQVSEATALGLSAYYCGVNMIASTIGMLPLNVYRRDTVGRSREVVESHPVHWLLHNEPNPEMTAMTLRQTWLLHIFGRGNAFGEIERNGRGIPVAIWPITPDRVTVRRDENLRIWYEIRTITGEMRYIRREDMLHIPGLGYDGIMGYGLIQLAMEDIGLNTAQEQYAGKFFRNGGNVSMTLETPNTLKDDQFERLKNEVVEKFSGLSNAHRIAILENGMKATPLNPTHEQSQLIESRRFSVEQWARWLNMPLHKLKELTHATFSNIEHQNIEWVVDCILPWLTRHEQEFNRKLFGNPGIFYTKHVVEGQLRGDMKTRYEAYGIGRTWGWLSANDVLELEDRNPLPGGQGDIYLIPANMVRADAQPEVQRAAAARLVRAEARLLESNGVGGTYGEDFEKRVATWVGVSPEVAKRYANVAAQLNLIAREKDVNGEVLAAAKVSVLMKLANGGTIDGILHS